MSEPAAHAPRYPGYDVLEKWDSPSFDDVTRKVITKRLSDIPERRFLEADEWALLEALAAHLMPQPERRGPIPIVPWIDAKLANGKVGDFRRTGEPHDPELWREGLAAIGREARRRYDTDFTGLPKAEREQLLQDIRAGAVSDGWTGVAPKRFLVDILLKAIVGVYYSHPHAWSEIGFGGPASPRGYVRLQLDKHDQWEADEAK